MRKVGLKGGQVVLPAADEANMSGRTRRQMLGAVACLGAAALLGGCVASEVRTHGFVLPEDGLDQVPVGSSRDQVLIVLGTPQTTATLDNEVFYYITQRSEQAFAFSRPEIIDQRVIAIYFDQDSLVERVANYGLQDGVIFDFVSETTPTGGQDITFIGQILGGLEDAPSNPFQ